MAERRHSWLFYRVGEEMAVLWSSHRRPRAEFDDLALRYLLLILAYDRVAALHGEYRHGEM